MPTIVRQFRKWSNWVHKKLPHLIYFALATNYFNVFMLTTVLLALTSFEQIGGQWIFGGASDFSNLLTPWASGSRSLMLRAVCCWLPHTSWDWINIVTAFWASNFSSKPHCSDERQSMCKWRKWQKQVDTLGKITFHTQANHLMNIYLKDKMLQTARNTTQQSSNDLPSHTENRMRGDTKKFCKWITATSIWIHTMMDRVNGAVIVSQVLISFLAIVVFQPFKSDNNTCRYSHGLIRDSFLSRFRSRRKDRLYTNEWP